VVGADAPPVGLLFPRFPIVELHFVLAERGAA
jgi:hypothetical protein